MKKKQTIENLMSLSAAVRIHFTWFGTRKTLTDAQMAEAAEQFGAEGKSISATKKLLDTRHSAYRGVSGIRSEARGYWRSITLPWPEPGIRLLRKAQLVDFTNKMKEYRDRLATAVEGLNTEYPAIRNAAKDKLGRLFNALDYPEHLYGQFAIEWDFPSVEPPPYLATLNPELYEQEKQRLEARFAEAGRMAEQAFAEELSKLVTHLSERVTDGPEGRKSFKASTLTNLNEFFDRFKSLSVSSNSELDKLVERAKETISGLDAKDIRKSEEIRAELAKTMEAIKTDIDAQLVTMPKRRIIGVAKPEAEQDSPAKEGSVA